MINWITNNLEMICSGIVAIPMVSTLCISIFFIIDDYCASFGWYGAMMYGGGKRDDSMAMAFFGKSFLGLGIVSIIIPCIVVYGYLYYSNISLAQFITNQTGGG